MSREALVVGVSTYRFEPLNTLKEVPAEDAEAIAQILETYGKFRVRRLPQLLDPFDDNARRVSPVQEVTVTALEDAIRQLFFPEGDHVPETALLYFSGHGLRKPWGKRQKGYLGTSDANPDQGQWGFDLTWLQEILQDSPIKQQIVWLDCCHSGELLSSSNVLDKLTISQSSTNENLKEINPGSEEDCDRCLITASRGFELAFQQVDNAHSVLTGALLKGLDPTRRSDSWVTNETLAEFIKQSLAKETQCPLFHNYGKPIVLTTAVARQSEGQTNEEVCPYKGLAYFDLEDAEFFYGRTALTDQLINKISNQNFLAVIGPSGSGKSSVVRAGLLYELKLGRKLSGSDRWQYNYKPFTPGEQPFKKLKQILGKRSNNLAKVIQKDEHERVVLFIDQFEECFTLCQNDKERQQFFDCLLDTLEQTAGKLCLIIAMRADFLGKCAEYPRLANKIRAEESLELVTPMGEADLREAIEEPAKKVGLEVEPLLVDRMIEDVEGYPGSLPLLQFTLTELWQTRKEPYLNALTLSAYNTLKGIKGALEKVANGVFESLTDKQQVVAKRIFLELIQPGQETEDTRRRVLKQSLVNEQQSEAVLDEVIGKLADARLLTRNLVDPENPQSPIVLDVVHEALIRHWKQLKEWLKQYRDAMRVERKLEDEAEEWEKLGKPEDPAHLRQGARLTEAQDYLEKYANLGMLNALAQEFIQASKQVQERLNREKDEQIKVLQRALTESRLRELAARTLNILLIMPQTSLEMAVQAIGENQEKLPDRLFGVVKGSLQQVMNQAHVPNKLVGHGGHVLSVAFSSDGTRIVSGSNDHTICLWDMEGNPIGQPFQGHTGNVNSVAFSPDGTCIVSGSDDRTVRLWNLEGNPIGQPFVGHEHLVRSVAFSPDGTCIVSGSFDNTLRLWDLEGNQIGQPFVGHEGSVNSVAFSPDGTCIVSGSDDRTVRLWDLEGNPIGQPSWGHKSSVLSVAFSPIPVATSQGLGYIIASSSHDQTIRLWDLKGSPIGQPFVGHTFHVWSVAFHPNATHIVSGSGDSTVRLWDLEGNQKSFAGYTHYCRSVAFSPDGTHIASGGEDQMIRLWNVEGNLIGKPFIGHEGPVQSVAFSPDGTHIASGGEDQVIRLWDTEGNSIGQPFVGHEGSVKSVVFSSDGKRIVSYGYDNTLRLWDLEGNQIGQPFAENGSILSAALSSDGIRIVSGHYAYNDCAIYLWDLEGNQLGRLFVGYEGSVDSIAFSPDGTYIASGSDDKTIRLWDLEGNQIGQPFIGHEESVSSVAFSPDGMCIVSGSYDNTLRLWDLEGNQIGQPFIGHEGFVNSVTFSPNGNYIVSGSSDKTTRLWRGNWQEWLSVCCYRLGYHLISNNPELEILTTDPGTVLRSDDATITTTQKACAACQKYAWTGEEGRRELAKMLRRQGNDLTRLGKTELAAIKFRQAIGLDPTLRPESASEILSEFRNNDNCSTTVDKKA